MAAKPGIPKGTRDFSPVEMAKRNYIFNTIREVFHLFGYQQIENMEMKGINYCLRYRTQAITFRELPMRSC